MDALDAPVTATVSAAAPAETALTYVELVWFKGRIERWIRFGEIVDERIVDRRTRLVGFVPSAIFAFVRWAANDRGTVQSRIDILAAVERGGACSTVPGVVPGGVLLLRLSGWPKVTSVLRIVDEIEAQGIEPACVSPDFWRHAHGRLVAGQTPRSYSRARHRAWLLQRELRS